MRPFYSLLHITLSLKLVDCSFNKARLSPEPVSQSESSSRDGHGAATGKQGPRNNLRSGLPSKARRPMLELVGLSLETFGSKIANSSIADHPALISVTGDSDFDRSIGFLPKSGGDRHVNILAQVPNLAEMFDSRSFEAHSLSQALNFHLSAKEVKLGRWLLLSALLLVPLVALIFYCLTSSMTESSYADDEKMYAHLKDSRATRSEAHVSQSSWARAYYEAEGAEKEAFELLFRCNIISTEEFACSAISQEHIQESLWIGTHMLQHKPLDEWVGVWQQAQQSFEDNVAECFQAGQGGQAGFPTRGLFPARGHSRSPYMSPGAQTSMPSSANLDFVSSSNPNADMRPLQS